MSITHIQEITASWPLDLNIKCLHATLHEASRRATSLNRTILASYTQPIKWIDTIRIVRGALQAQLGDLFFWERPSEQITFIGIGTATTFETQGATRFTDAASAWQSLLNNAAIFNGYKKYHENKSGGPMLFGGFAFDPFAPHTSLWEGFPDGLLILPRLLLNCNARGATLTINKLIHPTKISVQIGHYLNDIVADVTLLRTTVEQSSNPSPVQHTLSLQNILPPSQWMEVVGQTAQDIRDGKYEKVVLARDVQVTPVETADNPFEVSTVLQRLREHNSTGSGSIFAFQRGERTFIGATPERLIHAHDGQIETMALAGSAPRGATEEEDERIGAELLHSMKNHGEHEIVVETMRETLSHLCEHIMAAREPHLLKLNNVQHLETPIVGTLLPDHSILEVVSELHPTPAVGGFPRQAALEAIRANEHLDRGWYAGPIGWVDAHGNGEFAVALRSAIIHKDTATLFAGCGIVADSDPQSEYTESCLKLQEMLRGLGSED